MVAIKPQGQWTYRVGSIDDVLGLKAPARKLGAHPYPFEITCSPQRPTVIAVFQEGFLVSPFDDDEYKEDIKWKARMAERYTEILAGKEDQIPRELVHIAYDPDLLLEEGLRRRVPDTFGRLGYSPVRKLPDFSKKDVDLTSFIESQRGYMVFVMQNEDPKAPGVRENLQRFKDSLTKKSSELKPYGLTLAEYSFFMGMSEQASHVIKGIDGKRGR